MDNYFKKIQQVHESLHMSDAEKDRLDDVVLAFVDEHPLPKETVVSSQQETRVRYAVPSVSAWSFFGKKFAYAMAAVVLLLGSGVGTVLASEKSLPGEPLYTVKVNVAEEIRSALIFSPEEKATWEASRVERRLSEIKTLLEQGDAIEKHIIDDVEGHIEEHSNEVAKAAISLQMKGDTAGLISLVDQLQVSLESYANVLAQIVQDDKGQVDPKVVALFESVEQTQQVAKAAQLDLLLEKDHLPDGGNGTGTVVNDALKTDVRITTPKDGDILIMGTRYNIAWKANVNDGSYSSIALIDQSGTALGYIGAAEYPSISMEWNPKYVLDISNTHQSKEVTPGLYRLRLTVRDQNGKAYQTESGLFEVVKPSIATGQLHVTVLDGVGNPIQNAYVEVNRTNQSRLKVEYTDVDGQVDFSLLPGTYTVLVSSMRSDDLEERTVNIAEVGETYISISMIPARTETDIQTSGTVDLTISDVRVSNTSPHPGEWFTLTYVVENIGNPGIAGKRSHGLLVSPSNEYILDQDVTDSCVYKAYLTNEDRCIVTRRMKIDSEGEYVITAQIDDENFIQELSETNNTLSVPLRVEGERFGTFLEP